MQEDTPLQPLTGWPLAWMTLGVSLAMFMQVLDTTIANVAIPAISGDLAVSPNQGTWVITSFTVSNAIALPLTGWLAQRFGEVRLFICSIIGFTLASWLCGMAEGLDLLILSRVLQGFLAGPMIPLSQSLLLRNYPVEKRGIGLSFWVMTTTCAPILGPLIGGYVTDHFNWPWIFFINVPVGIFCVALCWQSLAGRETTRTKLPIDTIGLALLVLGVGSLQMMLDRGQDLDWFSSTEIRVLAVLAVVALAYFVVYELTEKYPIVDLSLLKDRNFTLGVLTISIGYMTFLGSVVVFPLWLQTQLGFTAFLAGQASAPIGILPVLLSPIIGLLLPRLPLKWVVIASLGIFSATFYWHSHFNNQYDFFYLMLPRFAQGAAMATYFLPLTTIMLSNVAMNSMAKATGLSNFLRMIGGSFGTSLSIALWEERTHMHHSQLVEFVTPERLSLLGLTHGLDTLGLSAQQSWVALEYLVKKEAVVLATNDVYWLGTFIFLGLIVVIWFTKPVQVKPKAIAVAAE